MNRQSIHRWLKAWPHCIVVLLFVLPPLSFGSPGIRGLPSHDDRLIGVPTQMTAATDECACAEGCELTPTATTSPTTEPTVTVTPTTEPTETMTATVAPTEEPISTTPPTQPPVGSPTAIVIGTATAEPTVTEPIETMTATVAPTEEPISTTTPTQPIVGSPTAIVFGTATPTQPIVGSPTATAIVTATATITTTEEPTASATSVITSTRVITDTPDDAAGPLQLVSGTPQQMQAARVAYRVAQPAAEANQPNVIPGCRVELVDFNDNIKVVQDRDGAKPRNIDAYTDACGVADEIEWKDCAPKGTKNWPVAYVQDTQIKIAKAVFVLPPAVKLKGDVEVTGSASADNLPLTFTGKGTPDDSGKVSVANLTSTGKLPKYITAFKNLKITWQLKGKDKDGKDRGPFELASSHPIYVLLAAPSAPPKPKGADPVPVYLTLVDISTARAKGKSAKDDVVTAIWAEFQTLKVSRRDLNPETGEISVGAALKYYTPWTLEKNLLGTYDRSTLEQRPWLADLLELKVSICSAWALFLADTLRIHGIAADVNLVRPDKGPGANVDAISSEFVLPASDGATLLLVKTWTFQQDKAVQGDFPYVLKYNIKDDKVVPVTQTFDHDPKKAAAGQNNAQPPGFFSNHVIVYYTDTKGKEKIYDPSYGSGPFDSLEAWTEASLSGYMKGSATKTDGDLQACRLSRDGAKKLVCGK